MAWPNVTLPTTFGPLASPIRTSLLDGNFTALQIPLALVYGEHLNVKNPPYSAKSDGVTDDTEAIHAALLATVGPARVYIPPNTVWDYLSIASDHHDDVIIEDWSGYDWAQDPPLPNSAQVRLIAKTSSPGTKNANSFIFSAPYHPSVVIENLDPTAPTTGPQPQKSIIFRQAQPGGGTAGEWQIVAEWYGGNTLFAIKDIAANPDRNPFEILGGDGADNEIAFNSVASVGVAFAFATPYAGSMVVRWLAADNARTVVHSAYGGVTEYFRTQYLPTGEVQFQPRVAAGAQTVLITADGHLHVGTASGSYNILGLPAGASEGDQALSINDGFAEFAAFYSARATGFNSAAAALKIKANGSTGRSINAAGSINASGADYAEYEPLGGLKVLPGDVVGFTETGMLTRSLAEAKRFGVVSTDPGYVGADRFSTGEAVPVAYAGKVAVNVQGASPGNYIVAGAGPDGLIVGTPVSVPTFEQYLRAVGRVNCILPDGRAEIAIIVH